MQSRPNFATIGANMTVMRINWILASGLATLLAASAAAQDRSAPRNGRSLDLNLRDAQGRRTGTVERGPGQTYIQRDSQGRRVGTVEPGPKGQYIVRDAQGRRTGTVEPR